MKPSNKKKRTDHNSLDTLYRKRDRALERVITTWEQSGDSEEKTEELNRALDVLTMAHTAATFEWASGL